MGHSGHLNMSTPWVYLVGIPTTVWYVKEFTTLLLEKEYQAFQDDVLAPIFGRPQVQAQPGENWRPGEDLKLRPKS